MILTVKIITKQPQVQYFEPLLAYNGGAIVSTAAIDKWGKDLGKHPVGTGAFKLKEEVAGEYVRGGKIQRVLGRHEKY